MKTQIQIQFKKFRVVGLAGIFLALAFSTLAADPRTNCWFTADSGQYAKFN
ncbi:MAG TPA: hypothetical protein VIK53_18095 [Verrucomicrobiae bacterium]